MTWGRQNTEAEAHEQLSYAWDMGLNFMDTAEVYPVPVTQENQGKTEKYIGSWLKQRKREDVILATKVAGYGTHSTYLRDPPCTTRVTGKQIEEALNKSLARLQTDYVDLYQIHWPDRYVPLFGAAAYDVSKARQGDIPFEEQLKGLERMVKAGKVRYVGVSNETSYGVAEFSHLAATLGLPKIETIQNCYSMLVRSSYETDLAETCYRHNVSLLAYSPLAGGALSGKYNHNPPPTSRFCQYPGYMERYNKGPAKSAVAEYEAIAAKYGLTLTQMALAFCKSRWFVASSIIGATSLAQLKENLAAFNVVLPQEALADINAVYARVRDPTLL